MVVVVVEMGSDKDGGDKVGTVAGDEAIRSDGVVKSEKRRPLSNPRTPGGRGHGVACRCPCVHVYMSGGRNYKAF